MPLPGGKSFDEMVRKVKQEQNVSDESAKRIVGSIEQKIKKSKLELKILQLKQHHAGIKMKKKPKKSTPVYAKDHGNHHNVQWYNTKLGKVRTASLVDESKKYAKWKYFANF